MTRGIVSVRIVENVRKNYLSSNRTAIGSHASVVYMLSLMMLNQVLKLVGFTMKKEAGKVAENVSRA